MQNAKCRMGFTSFHFVHKVLLKFDRLCSLDEIRRKGENFRQDFTRSKRVRKFFALLSRSPKYTLLLVYLRSPFGYTSVDFGVWMRYDAKGENFRQDFTISKRLRKFFALLSRSPKPYYSARVPSCLC